MSRRPRWKFLLYVADNAQNSLHAIANLHTLCAEHLAGEHEIEVIDVLVHPERALTDGIFMTPTLVKLGPLPVQKIVGTLSDVPAVLHAFGIESAAA